MIIDSECCMDKHVKHFEKKVDVQTEEDNQRIHDRGCMLPSS